METYHKLANKFFINKRKIIFRTENENIIYSIVNILVNFHITKLW